MIMTIKESSTLKIKLVMQIQEKVDRKDKRWKCDDETLTEENVVKKKKNNEVQKLWYYVS